MTTSSTEGFLFSFVKELGSNINGMAEHLKKNHSGSDYPLRSIIMAAMA